MKKNMLDRTRGAMPLYKQIETIIKESIDNGEYSFGDILPAESEYMREYSVSRITVRQALQNLASGGYVKGQPGIGTIVAYKKIAETLKGIKSFSQEMEEHCIEMETVRCKTSYVTPPQNVANLFGDSFSGKCLKIERIRAAEDAPIVFSTTYIPASRNLPEDPACYMSSLYEYLYKEHGITVAKATDTLEAVIADKTLSESLKIKEGDAVFTRCRKSYDQNSSPLEVSISFYPGNRYSYTIGL